MTIDLIQKFLLISLAINYGILIFWFLMFIFQHDHFSKLYRGWFKLDESQFDTSMYWLMGLYKVGIFLFYLTPLIAVTLIK